MRIRTAAAAALLAAATTTVPVVAVTTRPAAALVTYTVTTTDDVVNGGDGVLSLREAVTAANGDGDDSRIELQAGLTYELDLCVAKEPIDLGGGVFVSPPDDDANADGDLDHTAADDLTIDGDGATVEQTCLYDRVLHSLSPASTVTLEALTVRGGLSPPEPGSGLRVLGSLAVTAGSLVTDNDGASPAVQVGDSSDNIPTLTLQVTDSSVSDNGDTALRIDYGTVTVTGSTVADNDGGGVTGSFADLRISGSTITGNAGAGVGGIDGDVEVEDSTVSGNGTGIENTGNAATGFPVVVTATDVTGNARGGIRCGFCTGVTVTDSAVDGNGSVDGPAGSFGGISFITNKTGPGITLTGSSVDDNGSPTDGGAIRVTVDLSDFSDPADLPEIVLDGTDVIGNRSGILQDGGAIRVQSSNLVVTDGSRVNGNRAQPSDLLAGGDGGAVRAYDGGSILVSGSEMRDNVADGAGGAISASQLDAVTITSSEVTGNTAESGGGGALDLFEVSSVTVTDSLLQGNAAQLAGGAVRVSAPDAFVQDVSIDGSTIAGNTVAAPLAAGGGIFGDGDLLQLELVNSTVTANVGNGPGGGIEVLGAGGVTLEFVTLVGNTANPSGPFDGPTNLYHQTGPLTAFGTVIGAGIGGGPECGSFSGAKNSFGFNLSTDGSCGFTQGTDQTGVGPLDLGPLADNGGPTPTLLPGATSPLAEQIPAGPCNLFQTLDQRDVTRPQGGACDIGAVEIAGTGPEPEPLAVGLVVAEPRFPFPDGSIRDLLAGAGFTVTLLDDDDLTAATAAASDVLVVSDSVRDRKLDDVVDGLDVPVVTWEGGLYDELGLAPRAAPGFLPLDTLRVVGTGPLAAGLQGPQQVLRAPAGLRAARPGPDAEVVAVDRWGRPVLFAYDAGDRLADGRVAGHRRVGLFLDGLGAALLTPAGGSLVVAAVAWAGAPPAGP